MSTFKVGDRVIWGGDMRAEVTGVHIDPEGNGDEYSLNVPDGDFWVDGVPAGELMLDARYYREIKDEMKDRMDELEEAAPRFKVGDHVTWRRKKFSEPGSYQYSGVVVSVPDTINGLHCVETTDDETRGAEAQYMMFPHELELDAEYYGEIKDALEEATRFKVGDHVIWTRTILTFAGLPPAKIVLRGVIIKAYQVSQSIYVNCVIEAEDGQVYGVPSDEIELDAEYYREFKGELKDRMDELGNDVSGLTDDRPEGPP